MQQHAVYIGGFEPGYMQKLAIYLSSRIEPFARIGIAAHADQVPKILEERSANQRILWIGSETFIHQLESSCPEESTITLSEDESLEEGVICRYQPCEKLYQELMQQMQELNWMRSVPTGAARQKWFLITADTDAASLMAFSLTFACVLRSYGSVLYLNLSECSGMGSLLQSDPGMDLADYIMALRRDSPLLPDAYVRRMEQVDLILPPGNPVILHEMNTEDTDNLIRSLQSDARYSSIVLALGSTCQGAAQLLMRADRICHLSGNSRLSECSREEWLRYLEHCIPGQLEKNVIIPCPDCTMTQYGAGQLAEWADGPPGDLVRGILSQKQTPPPQ